MTQFQFKYLQGKYHQKGGPGSGHHGHAGRPGQLGGSAPSGGIALGRGVRGLLNKPRGVAETDKTGKLMGLIQTDLKGPPDQIQEWWDGHTHKDATALIHSSLSEMGHTKIPSKFDIEAHIYKAETTYATFLFREGEASRALTEGHINDIFRRLRGETGVF